MARGWRQARVPIRLTMFHVGAAVEFGEGVEAGEGEVAADHQI